MRLFANLLITVSLCLGAIMAATAYVVPTSLPDAQFTDVTLNAPAGVRTDDAGKPVLDDEGNRVPLVEADGPDGEPTALTPEVLATLRDGGVKRVRVKQFAFSRWSGRWLFLLSAVGLGIGAWLVRMDAKAAHAAAAGTGESEHAGSPRQTLATIEQTVRDLHDRVLAMPTDRERLHAIVEVLGELQQNEITQFAESRTALVARYGLAGFANVMDGFAAGERQVNRAWSAAADGVVDEAVACLERAVHRFDDVTARLQG